jgi:hypothetical protein
MFLQWIIPNIIIAKLVLKQPIKPIDVLVVKLIIPLNIVKQHLPKGFFHLKVRKMIVDETHVQE